ncbi:RNA methyltransferase [Aurantibacter crassamenti]|uniref:TrmH family RNA methyltransferase n=1 Tax=Aurantibacter crassamenti TaxID=1837375 RepID=UPI00193A5D6B|nr:RNA methyltransferase [Aurantibacter crassamenti]MBM1106674.1 RNA methyltransferase [Aurantibacter crassamenti]
MDEYKQISSLQNALVKKILLLKDKSRERKKSGLFVIEGLRELQLALKGNYKIRTLLFHEELIASEIISKLALESQNTELISLSKAVYQKLAYRETTEGIIAVVESKNHGLSTLNFNKKNPLILVAEAPEKPGNIGAMLRTADAANIDAVIIADLKGDLYNPNVIRSSVGCVFTNTIVTATSEEVIAFLKNKNISIYTASLQASKNYLDIDFSGASAIVMGTESTGLTPIWTNNTDQNIIIPMSGQIDSMNVSVSAAILIFEAKRQRKLN